ncbi:MAG: hypothetical protein ACRD2O_08785, partial [Terriglobia bacterium]
MSREKRLFLIFCVASSVMAFGALMVAAQADVLGIFTNEGSVGITPPGCKAHYDYAKGEYT